MKTVKKSYYYAIQTINDMGVCRKRENKHKKSKKRNNFDERKRNIYYNNR